MPVGSSFHYFKAPYTQLRIGNILGAMDPLSFTATDSARFADLQDIRTLRRPVAVPPTYSTIESAPLWPPRESCPEYVL